jgi:hypothetical protein
MRDRLGDCDPIYGYGSLEGGWAAGRARRGESVIVGSKNRVHVNFFVEPMFAKVFRRPLSVGE